MRAAAASTRDNSPNGLAEGLAHGAVDDEVDGGVEHQKEVAELDEGLEGGRGVAAVQGLAVLVVYPSRPIRI